MKEPYLATRDKDSSSSDDSLSPTQAPLKELIAKWRKRADSKTQDGWTNLGSIG